MGGGLLRRGTCIGSQRFLSKEKRHCVDAANRDNAWLYFNLFNEQFVYIYQDLLRHLI